MRRWRPRTGAYGGSSPLVIFTAAFAVVFALGAVLITPLTPIASAAASAAALPPDASCARLAAANPTATNGATWGTTLLAGLGQSGGWFGVPVCANGVNAAAPGDANVSCDQAPSNYAATGCAPGVATSDGYGLTFQCVELVARFSDWVFGDAPSDWRGDAPYLWLSGRHPADFGAYPNGGVVAPRPGDILVWGSLDTQGQPWPAGPAGGHVAVVAATGGGQITFVEENMQGSRGDIPEETTTLTSKNGRWTIGPTYGTNGGRALYGWLSSSRNTGKFPAAGPSAAPGAPGHAVATPSGTATQDAPRATPQAAPQTQLSLAQGVLITGGGALAQLVWSDTHSPERSTPLAPTPSAQTSSAHALAESLGTPPNMTLAPAQTPAVITLPTLDRYIFARGEDGHLYAAFTASTGPGIAWQALGAPAGVTLTSGVTALWDAGTMMVGAIGSDGALWIRSGPAGRLGAWTSLGAPTNTEFLGTPALAETPGAANVVSASAAANASASNAATGHTAGASSGTPTPDALPFFLASGRDGKLYEADAYTPAPSTAAASSAVATSGNSGSASQEPTTPSAQQFIWRQWNPIPIPHLTAELTGELFVQSASPSPSVTTSGGANGAQMTSIARTTREIDALATDMAGNLWLLRRTAASESWKAQSYPPPAVGASLLDVSLAPLITPTAATASTSGHVSQSAYPLALQMYVAAPCEGSAQSTALQSHESRSAAVYPGSLRTYPRSSLDSSPAGVCVLVEALPLSTPPPTSRSSDEPSWRSLGEMPSTNGSGGGDNGETAVSAVGAPIALTLDAPGEGSGGALLLTTPDAQVLAFSDAATLQLLAPDQEAGLVATSVPSVAATPAPGPTHAVTRIGEVGIAATPTPSATATPPASSSQEASGPVTLGRIATPDSFSDRFSGDTLKPQWSVFGASSGTAQVAQGALTISALASTPRIDVAQGAPASPIDVTAQITANVAAVAGPHVRSQAASTLSAQLPTQTGIMLALDDWNSLSLSLRDDGTVALCPQVNGLSLSCQLATPHMKAGAQQGLHQSLFLRMVQRGANVVGEYSANGVDWSLVGSWQPTWLLSSDTAAADVYAPSLVAASSVSGSAGSTSSTSSTSSATQSDVATSDSTPATPVAYVYVTLFAANGVTRPVQPLGDRQTMTSVSFREFTVNADESPTQ